MSEEYYSEQDDFAVVHPEQDIRNWPVYDAEGRVLGNVNDLIFNTEAERVDFIELDNGSKVRVEDIEILDDRVRLRQGITLI